MMSGDISGDEFGQTRPVLSDLTNRPLKRGFSLISDELGLKHGDVFGRNLEEGNGDSQFAKQVCLGVESLIKEKCRAQSPASSVAMDASQENIVSTQESKHNDCKESMHVSQAFVELGDAARDNCSEASNKQFDDDWALGSSDVRETHDATREVSANHTCKIDAENLAVGRLASCKGGSIEWSRLPRSQSSRAFELDRCVGLKNDDGANLNIGVDMLKACSCSFCKKAAYIWSDLHYQDIKGRIAVLKKSQKEASALAQKNGRMKQTDINAQGSSSQTSNLESDLLTQWRSLFLNMEDIFVRESSQLQASYIALRDLRENCKMDLERTTGMPLDKE